MFSLTRSLFDLFCIFTGIGIWARFIEPKLLFITRLKVPLRGLKKVTRIVQISDLHLGKHTSPSFLKRLSKRIHCLKPDLIVLTGDFLCYGKIHDQSALEAFLRSLKAPLGIYSVLGNHDYEAGVGVDALGNYAIIEEGVPILQGLQRLASQQKIQGQYSEELKSIKVNPLLAQIFKDAGIGLLQDSTVQVQGLFNLTGVSEYMTGQIDPVKAFKGYERELPGILLCHNPDAIPKLLDRPPALILSGHTHGGQVNLPFIRKRLTLMQYPRYFKGLIRQDDKTIYISRGVGSVMNFRFLAFPEAVCIDLIPEAKR